MSVCMCTCKDCARVRIVHVCKDCVRVCYGFAGTEAKQCPAALQRFTCRQWEGSGARRQEMKSNSTGEGCRSPLLHPRALLPFSFLAESDIFGWWDTDSLNHSPSSKTCFHQRVGVCVCVGERKRLRTQDTLAVTLLQYKSNYLSRTNLCTLKATRALVLTGSRPLLLSDRQDVGCTFIRPRLWFLSCHSCLFSALLLHSARLLKCFSCDGACHSILEEGRVGRMKRWAYACIYRSILD